MLDRAEALAQREGEVLCRDIVLPVDEGAPARLRRARQRAHKTAVASDGRARRRGRGREAPAGSTPVRAGSSASRAAAAPAAAPSLTAALSAKTPRQAPALRVRSAAAPGRKACRLSLQVSLPRDCEYRCTLGVKPPDMSTRSHGWVCALSEVPTGKARRVQSQSTRRRPWVPSTMASFSTGMPAARAPLAAGARGARVGDAGDEDARRLQVERRLVGLIAGGHEHCARAGQHAVAVELGARRPREHDPGPVVAREDQRPLDGAGGEHHLPRPHLPLPLARGVGGGSARWSVRRSLSATRLCGK